MNKIIITDIDDNEMNILYLYNELLPLVSSCDGKIEFEDYGDRHGIVIDDLNKFSEFIKCEIDNKIAEVITISYKYKFFKDAIKPKGLTAFENELLLTSLISADIEEDKRYVKGKLKFLENYSIDGIFNFRLGLLKDKWYEIISYIPLYFSEGQLKDFVMFLLEECNMDKIIISERKVFDVHFNRLNRSFLTGDENNIIKEIILSHSGRIELMNKLNYAEEEFLKEYYGKQIIFNKNYYLS